VGFAWLNLIKIKCQMGNLAAECRLLH